MSDANPQETFSDFTKELSKTGLGYLHIIVAGVQPTIYGDGEQSRDFTYIDNVVHANLLAAAAPAEKVSGRMMNLATGNRITLNETFAILRESDRLNGEPAYAPARAGDIRDSLADIRLARELLGYEPIVDFREGLRRTVEWYRGGGGAE